MEVGGSGIKRYTVSMTFASTLPPRRKMERELALTPNDSAARSDPMPAGGNVNLPLDQGYLKSPGEKKAAAGDPSILHHQGQATYALLPSFNLLDLCCSWSH